ncbi:MAG: Abi family protein [Clostridiales bacterium]|nr:Abi family protein [Clostridiales bacterium]
MLDYKTYDEQINILLNRGMIIFDVDAAKEALMRHNYYNIINGYKDLFILKGSNPEKYILGTTFDEIYAMHQFDKTLRHDLSHYLTLIERTFKSVLAHKFAYANQNNAIDFYLDIANYNPRRTVQTSQLITKLSDELDYAISKSNPMILHYKSKYNFVPIWVFINIISFGTLSKMYECLPSKVRDSIAVEISQISGVKLFPDTIQNALSVLVFLRNKCAHDQRIYDFNTFPTNIKPNSFTIRHLGNVTNIQSLFGTLSCFSFFIKPLEFSRFIKNFKNTVKEFFTYIHSIPNQSILDKMGVPQSFLS